MPDFQGRPYTARPHLANQVFLLLGTDEAGRATNKELKDWLRASGGAVSPHFCERTTHVVVGKAAFDRRGKLRESLSSSRSFSFPCPIPMPLASEVWSFG